MKYLLIALLFGCGQVDPEDLSRPIDCIDGCVVYENRRTPVVPQGPKGDTGEQGRDGREGPKGDRGEIGPTGARGDTGARGTPGKDGTDGSPGTGCYTEPYSNGAIIYCESSSVIILNGVDGEDGVDGIDGQNGEPAPPGAYTFVDIYDPCGPESDFDEILFLTAGGEWIAHYAHGNKQFLTVLKPGTYTVTDGTGCMVRINADGSIIDELSEDW